MSDLRPDRPFTRRLPGLMAGNGCQFQANSVVELLLSRDCIRCGCESPSTELTYPQTVVEARRSIPAVSPAKLNNQLTRGAGVRTRIFLVGFPANSKTA